MKKIQLNKKTLRELSADEAMAVAGGTFTHASADMWCNGSYDCYSDGCFFTNECTDDYTRDCSVDCSSDCITAAGCPATDWDCMTWDCTGQ